MNQKLRFLVIKQLLTQKPETEVLLLNTGSGFKICGKRMDHSGANMSYLAQISLLKNMRVYCVFEAHN